MSAAIFSAPALMRWDDLRFLHHFHSRDLAWLLIGVLLAGVAIWLLSRRRRRWL